MLNNTSNQPYKFRTKNWVKINDESRRRYNFNSQIKFKTMVLKSSLRDYGDAYILVKGTITVKNTGTAAAPNNRNKKAVFKNRALFTNCICEINNTQLDNTKDIDIVMPVYHLIECSNNYSKTPGNLWQYCKDIPAVNNNGNIVNFNEATATDSFNSKVKTTGQTDNDGEIDNVEIIVALKYLSNFCRKKLILI